MPEKRLQRTREAYQSTGDDFVDAVRKFVASKRGVMYGADAAVYSAFTSFLAEHDEENRRDPHGYGAGV